MWRTARLLDAHELIENQSTTLRLIAVVRSSEFLTRTIYAQKQQEVDVLFPALGDSQRGDDGGVGWG